MNKIILISVACLLAINFVMPVNTLFGQEKVCYWFYIKVGKSIDKETKASKLHLQKMGNQIESGAWDEFVLNHKKGLKNRKIVVGPFTDHRHAQNAMQCYQSSAVQKLNPEITNSENLKDTIYYYYLTRPVLGKWMRPISFEHIPARISPGTKYEYQAMLDEGMSFQFLAIGPFPDYGLAEKSKFIFRKNGEKQDESTVDSSDMINMNAMAERWETIKLEFLKLPKKKNTDKISYRLYIKFPKKYFIENAFQTISIKAKYSDSTSTSNAGLTLQGNYAMDNNPVIPYEKTTSYSQTFKFNFYKEAKIEGFVVESFIFTGNQMIGQKPRFVKTK